MGIEKGADSNIPIFEGYNVNLCKECVEEWGEVISENTPLKTMADIPTNDFK